MLLSLIHLVINLPVHLVAAGQPLCLQLLRLPLDPPSASSSLGPGVCLAHDNELQLLQDTHITKMGGNKIAMVPVLPCGLSPVNYLSHFTSNFLSQLPAPGTSSFCIRCKNNSLTETV